MATAAPKSSRQSRRDWEDRVKAWVERTCAEQGVPVKLTDPVALQHIADIYVRDSASRTRCANASSSAQVISGWLSTIGLKLKTGI
jgi:hypothetical protein